jgi:hypothetical protein
MKTRATSGEVRAGGQVCVTSATALSADMAAGWRERDSTAAVTRESLGSGEEMGPQGDLIDSRFKVSTRSAVRLYQLA